MNRRRSVVEVGHDAPVAAVPAADRRRPGAGHRVSGRAAPAAADGSPLFEPVALVRDGLPALVALRRHLPFALFAAAIALLVVAVGAAGGDRCACRPNQTTIILSMDVSGSMCSADIAPNRLEAAEAAAASFIESQAADADRHRGVQRVRGDRPAADVGPRACCVSALQSLVTGRRTAIGSGILAVDRRDQPRSTRASPASITTTGPGRSRPPPTPARTRRTSSSLLTDGANNAGPAPADAAKQAADRGVRVYTIGFGTADGGSFSGECARQFIGNEPGGGGGGFGGGGFGGGGGGGFRRGIDEDTLKEVATLTGGDVSPGRKRRPAEGGLREPPDEPGVPHGGRRDQRRVRGARRPGRGRAIVAREALAAVALMNSASRERVPRRCPRLRARWDPDPTRGEWLPRTARVAMR